MRLTKRFALFIILILITHTGCGLKAKSEIESSRPQTSVDLFEKTDSAVSNDDVENAWGSKVCGFPYLRSNRFFSYIKGNLKTRDEYVTWAKYLKDINDEARKYEIMNLSAASFQKLKTDLKITGDRQDFIEYLKKTGDTLFEKDMENPEYFNVLKEEVETPEDYSTALRVFGAYPLFYGPIAYFSGKVFKSMKKMTSTPVEDIKIRGELLSYSPSGKSFDQNKIKEIFSKTKKDSLGIPLFSEEDKITLFESFAPSYVQDTKDSWDKIGEVVWKDNILSVDENKPAVYYYLTRTYIKNKPAVQLNYVNWYSRRDGSHVKWYEKGILDGINIRITLNDKGVPVMTDVVHQCACFHFFIPNKEYVKEIKNQSFQFDALVLSYLPENFPQKRLTLRVQAGGHLIDNIGVEKDSEKIRYRLIPYNNLMSLKKGSMRASMFDSEGIAVGSERSEPLFLFMMGVPEIGAMRQRGHHPTKLVGKAHFDDPMFFNNAFEFK